MEQARARHVLTILAVEDLPRALRFYRAAFGWEVAVEVPVYAELALPAGLRLGLYAREAFGRNVGRTPGRVPPGELAPFELYLHVEDAHAALARALAAGGRQLSPVAARDWGDEAAYVADPEGNVVVVARPLASRSLHETVTRWMALWRGAALDDFEELHAPDFVDHAPAGRAGSREGFRRGIVELRAAFPDFHATIEDVLVEAERGLATVRWSATGTHRGAFLGVAPSGRVISFRGIEIIRVAAGRVAERWGEWDGLELRRQLEGGAPG